MSIRPVRHKFKAIPVWEEGFCFSSKLEHRYYHHLLLQKRAGHILFFLRQIPFHLPNGVKYIADYEIFYHDGTVRFVDVKGVETKEFVTKKKLVEALYPVTIDIVKKDDF